MAYPGNPELSQQAQDRVMTAFKQVVGKLQQGNQEEALIGLEFVLRLDPAYAPARSLHQQLSSGATEIDLNDVLEQLQAPTTAVINSLLVEAVEAFDERDFDLAREKVDQVLLDIPGHEEARFLLSQIEGATKGATQVTHFLQQARKALAEGESHEAANFVMMAQALDPNHSGIAETIAEIEEQGLAVEAPPGLQGENARPEEPEEPDGGIFGPPVDTGELFTDTGTDVSAIGDGSANVFGNVAAAEEPAPAAPQPHVSAGAEVTPQEPGETEAPPGPEPEADQDDAPYYDDKAAGGEVIETGPAVAVEDAGETEVDPSDPQAVIRDLLFKGGSAAADDDYSGAIDAWSRILLIDHSHEEALDRIEHIRHAKDEVDRRTDPMLEDARSAHQHGDFDLAADFVRRVLELSPNHVEATILQEDIQRGAPPDSKGSAGHAAMPDLEDELFTDEAAEIADLSEEIAALPSPSGDLPKSQPSKKVQQKHIPWRWVAVAGVGVAIVGIAMWFGGVLAPEPESEARVNVVNRVLAEANELFEQKRVEEAILLLEENSSDDPGDPFQVRIDRALERYHAAVATPVPTPIPEGLTVCSELLAEGHWMAAYERVTAELKAHPNDPGLEAVRQEILEVEPAAADLHDSASSGDYRSAVELAEQLMTTRADDPELAAAYDRYLFNAALEELRAFNLPAAENYLTKLQQRLPEDSEIPRILEFVSTYKTRPVDMQLKIFVGNLVER
jgi:tetratricopeptide (TPR) repeat protein